MKKELSVKKCTSEIFWGIVLHSIWLGIICGIVMGVLMGAIGSESVIVENVFSLAFSGIALFLAAKLTNKSIVKKYNVNTEILDKVVKRLWTIVIILGTILLVARMLLLPMSIENEIEKLENSYFITYDEEDIQKIRDELEAQLPSTYAILIVFTLLSIGLELVMMKYAVYDLKNKANEVNSTVSNM